MIIAHRGGHPENTLEAFKFCVLNNVDGIEFDVWFTLDEKYIVTHDSEIDGHYIESLTYIEIKKINPTIPTLEETLNIIENTSKYHNFEKIYKIPKLNIEIKPFGISQKLAIWLRQYINEHPTYNINNFIITSFLHTEIDIFHKEYPEMQVGWLFACFPMNLEDTLSKYPYISTIVLGRSAVYYKYIKLLLEKIDSNIDIWVYCEGTIKQIMEINELFSYGIDAFITDYPIQCQKRLK